ncbi:hypothetical protein BDV25DRAFT_93475 [Aspergillus avenaceus]|uniref:Uncharacterized protein n=1 Tax=Aspergillus avenaceus TaxID=36643 RepID=A0A5N6TDV1_ASPAV|nr:hypothetical protein BDV25DRAFT_93475 [Aspergillus avenaceus]
MSYMVGNIVFRLQRLSLLFDDHFNDPMSLLYRTSCLDAPIVLIDALFALFLLIPHVTSVDMTHYRQFVVRSFWHLHITGALGSHSFHDCCTINSHSTALLSFLLVSQVWVFGIGGF